MSKPKKAKKSSEVLRIGVDLDGCVDDLFDYASLLIKKKLGVDFKAIIKKGPVNFYLDEWPEIKRVPGGQVFVREIFKKSDVYKHARPVPGAVKILNKWKKQGHQIWLITARPKKITGKITLKWLEDNNLGWAKKRILFTGYSYKERANFKSKVAQELDLHVFIEDHAEAVRAIDSSSMIIKLVLKYPWNMVEDIGRKAKFVKDWQEMDKIIQKLSS
jgi:predicted secreted acid phosphatase